jgi:hypothetical protein
VCAVSVIGHLAVNTAPYNKELNWFIIAHLYHIFNLSFLSERYPLLWKQVAVVPIFKKGNRALVTNYRPIWILNNFSKISGSIDYDHISFTLKSKLHPSQHGLIKWKSMVTNLVTS